MKNRFIPNGSDTTKQFAGVEQASKIALLGHYVWDVVADRCLYCSDQHAANHGMNVEEYTALASTLNGLAHPDDIGTVRQAFADLRTGQPFEIDYRVVTPGGETRMIREIGHPVFDDGGQVIQEIGTSQDITRQTALEHDLRSAQTSLETALEALPLGFASYDKDGILVNFNQRYRELVPFTSPHIKLGIVYEDMLRLTADKVSKACGYDNVETYMADRLEATCTQGNAWIYRQSRGVWVKVITRPVSGGGFISIIEDITVQKTQENQLLQAQKMEAIGQLTGGIAHDFNNLLAVILGNAELLMETSAEASPLLEDIIQSANRGGELTRSLLAFARRQVLAPKPVDLVDLTREFAKVLRRTFGEDISVQVDIKEDTPNAFADRAQIESALLNLALNARAAMPNGGTLTVTCGIANAELLQGSPSLAGSDKTFVVLGIEDTGTGMTEDQIAHVFEPFYTTKGVGEGSGLGLSMVYGFAQQSGGDVQVDSRQGKGTRMSLILPGTQSLSLASVKNVDAEKPRGSGELILIVEDDPSVQSLVRKQLQLLNYKTLCASDGNTASQIVKASPDIDLILSDVVLPGGTSGPQFARSVLSIDASMPILFMSGHAKEDLDDIAEFGSDVQLLPKPFSHQQLAKAIRSTLGSTVLA